MRPVDLFAAAYSGKIYTDLKAAGLTVGNQDILIAGICLAKGLPLLTRNTAHFASIKGLAIFSKPRSSVTMSRSRRFSTPVGLFIYRQIPARAYEAGMVRVEAENDQAFLIASPEKALADKIVSVRGAPITSIAEMRRFLEEDLRIDAAAVRSLSAGRIDEFAERYRSMKLRRLSGLVRRLERSGEETPHE
ncbi:MAG: type II toxin-antitoxin system VapC family toxin [Candidatus Aminicenantales bacterium]